MKRINIILLQAKLNKCFYFKKSAAMFGLDARIALAIFGALSVITGAALYSAIKNAKSTALVTQMEEINKAVSSYLLDVGVDIPSSNINYHNPSIKELIESTEKSWNGPYLPISNTLLQKDTNDRYFFMLNNHKVLIARRSSNAWTQEPAPKMENCSVDNCFYWVLFCEGSAEILKGMSSLDGNLRLLKWGDDYCAYLQGPPVLNHRAP